jgi:hypothetical protein
MLLVHGGGTSRVTSVEFVRRNNIRKAVVALADGGKAIQRKAGIRRGGRYGSGELRQQDWKCGLPTD